MQLKQKLDVQVRWMIRRDMPEILNIEHESFEHPWTEEDFLCCLRQRNCIGMVAEHRDRVVGYMIYELLRSQLHVLNFCVDSSCKNRGVGTAMVEKLVNKLSQQRRQRITLEVRESNLEAQLFFNHRRFLVTDVLRGHYEDTDEDAYHFVYDIGEEIESRRFTGRQSLPITGE